MQWEGHMSRAHSVWFFRQLLNILAVLCVLFSSTLLTSQTTPVFAQSNYAKGPVTTSPAAFGKVSPADSLTGASFNLTLSWAASSGAASYQYCFDTTNDNDCKKSERCRHEGKCTAKFGRCFATSDETCRKAPPCKAEGRCTAKDEYCVATSDTDCQQSDNCKAFGSCAARNDNCIITSDVDCKQAKTCQDEGKCTFRPGDCVAASDESCKAAKVCRDGGKCRVKDDECVK